MIKNDTDWYRLCSPISSYMTFFFFFGSSDDITNNCNYTTLSIWLPSWVTSISHCRSTVSFLISLNNHGVMSHLKMWSFSYFFFLLKNNFLLHSWKTTLQQLKQIFQRKQKMYWQHKTMQMKLNSLLIGCKLYICFLHERPVLFLNHEKQSKQNLKSLFLMFQRWSKNSA